MDGNETLINLTLKEYDGLRKEIDARTDATKTYGWPVIILVFGSLVGLKSINIDINLALLFIPAIIMTIAALAANANYTIDKTRIALAGVENRIFILSEKSLLMHESLEVSSWTKEVSRWWLMLSLTASTLYIAVEIWLYSRLLRNSINTKEYIFLLFLVLLTPVVIYLYNSIMRYKVRNKCLSTSLIIAIRTSEEGTANNKILIYELNAKELSSKTGNT